MNHTSHKVVQMVTGYNNLYGEPKVWLALLIADFTAIWPFQLSFYICAFKTRHIGLTTSKVKSIIRTRTASAAKTSLRKWIRVCSIFISIIPVIQTYLLWTGVFFAWAGATAEQAMCIEGHHRVCLHQNGASQSYRSDYFARWSWRKFSWFNKMCSLQKTL